MDIGRFFKWHKMHEIFSSVDPETEKTALQRLSVNNFGGLLLAALLLALHRETVNDAIHFN